ncbi:MAG: ABC transporter permease [Candidatus Eisenbacteria bacterium]|nr:ABC transporter permease [Candidatus Eisenbacteria bacterium]
MPTVGGAGRGGLAVTALRAVPIALAILTGLGLGLVIVLLMGVSPGEVGDRLARGILLSPYGWGQVLYKTTFLIFTGLAVALAFAAGLFNIGAEGQVVIGSLCCALVGIACAPLPGPLLLPLAILAAFAGGALWGLLPGWLRARFGTHEVITTIMLNFIAMAAANFLITRALALPETVRTTEVGAGAWLFRFEALLPGMHGSAANASLLLAVGAALLAHFFLYHTPLGLTLRAVGQGPRQSWILGIRPGRRIVLAFLLAGGLAGLAGTNFVLGYKHYYEDGYTGGIGFLGIAVALIARNRPLAVLPAALLFGFLSQAGFVVNSLLPREVIDVLTGAILLVFVAADRLQRGWSLRLRMRRLAAAAGEEGA